MSAAELLGFSLVLATAAAVPGPDIAAIVGRAFAVGLWRTLPLVAGIILGHAVWMLAAVSGLAALARLLGPAFVAIKIAAALYLIYLAWRLWFGTSADDRAASGPHRGGAVLSGLLVSFSNPKAMVFFGAVVPSIVAVDRLNGLDVAVLIAASSATFALVFTSWAAIAARTRTLLRSVAVRRVANRFLALVLTGAAVAVTAR
jgi:threonine/homoserine/homoserine lactone efflux protein